MHTFAFDVAGHDDPDERALQPPSRQLVRLTSVQGNSLVRSAVCAYLSMLGLVVNGVEGVPEGADWPTEADADDAFAA